MLIAETTKAAPRSSAPRALGIRRSSSSCSSTAQTLTAKTTGWTALMWATTNHNEDLVRVLLDHGASSAAKTARGHTAMNIASSNLSGSDTESFRRGSESPPASDGVLSQGNEEPALASVSPPRAGSLSEASAHEQANGGDASEALKDSPRPAGHAFVGTPTRKGQARDPASAGQSVLSMLQASSAKTGSRTRDSSVVSGSERGHISPTRSASSSQVAAEGLGLAISGDREPSGNPILSADSTVAGDSELADRLRTLTMNKAEYSDSFAKDGVASNGGDKSESQPFDWDTLQLDQMYVISAATVPQFLHAVVKDVRPERWIQANVQPEHKFIAASMIFLAARFAHHLGTPDFLESFLADTIAAIIHEVQSHKADPISLAFWMSNIQALIYFFKRDAALVQATSEAQGRLSECMQDAYSLFTKAIQAEIEPLIDASLLAYDSMPDLFADVKFEADKSQRLSMFFFGSQTEATRKSSDGRPLRRSQTVLQKGGRGRRKGSILSAVRPSIETTHSGANGAPPATASGDVPAWIACVERAKYVSSSTTATGSAAASDVRPSSGDTFVSGRASQDTQRPSLATAELFGHPSPRTVTYMLERMLDLFDMCETHPYIVWGIMRQMFCYLGSEMFNRVLTTRDFCSRSRAMQIRMNATQINDWVRKNTARLPVPQSAGPAAARSSVASTASFDSGNGGNEKSANASTAPETGVSNPEMLLYETYFKPLIELVQLLQCLTHLPDLSEYLETTSSMLTLNLLQQETVVSNYRYEVHESRVASDVAEYLQSAASDVRDRQRASREKVSMDKARRAGAF
ncbi:hypothetical protein GQ54DRAFT_27129 [Martensiomyces pterosporus]|nr:hypothetical protein GQ54DRAFT_27129 [Martensiomyces pterosporus]